MSSEDGLLQFTAAEFSTAVGTAVEALIAGDREDNCKYYARYMAEVNRSHAEVMYWAAFAVVLGLLFWTSWHFGRTVEVTEHLVQGDPRRRRPMLGAFINASFCGIVALIIVITEAFTLFALQFCDGEPIITLYWATWTMLQVGAVIAIFGISLHISHILGGRKHPPWALALGTPVLVVAGLGHLCQTLFQHSLRKYRGSRSAAAATPAAPAMAMAMAATPGPAPAPASTPQPMQEMCLCEGVCLSETSTCVNVQTSTPEEPENVVRKSSDSIV